MTPAISTGLCWRLFIVKNLAHYSSCIPDNNIFGLHYVTLDILSILIRQDIVGCSVQNNGEIYLSNNGAIHKITIPNSVFWYA
jgi:hypothetical protein